MPGVFWPDVRTILAPGSGCMANIVIATEEGAFKANLQDYQSVVRLHKVIAAALNGWQRDANGQWVDPPVSTKAHSMPPRRPLPVADVDRFLLWIADGMPESPDGPPVA